MARRRAQLDQEQEVPTPPAVPGKALEGALHNKNPARDAVKNPPKVVEEPRKLPRGHTTVQTVQSQTEQAGKKDIVWTVEGLSEGQHPELESEMQFSDFLLAALVRNKLSFDNNYENEDLAQGRPRALSNAYAQFWLGS